MEIRDIKPSLFIVHDVSMTGGVSYTQEDKTRIDTGNENAEEETWKGRKRIFDVAEYNKARTLRQQIITLLKSKLSAADSKIGLFAADTPETVDIIQETEEEIAELLDEFHVNFNDGTGARYCTLTSSIISFRIASDNRQALEAISRRITDGLTRLKNATEAADVKEIRNTLKSLKGFDKLLPEVKSDALKTLVEDMRARARTLNKEINKNGKAIDELTEYTDSAAIDSAEFIIFNDGEEIEIPETPAIDANTAGLIAVAEEESNNSADNIPAIDADEFIFDGFEEEEESTELASVTVSEFSQDNTPERDKSEDWQD